MIELIFQGLGRLECIIRGKYLEEHAPSFFFYYHGVNNSCIWKSQGHQIIRGMQQTEPLFSLLFGIRINVCMIYLIQISIQLCCV